MKNNVFILFILLAYMCIGVTGAQPLKVNLSHLNELYDPKTGGWWEFWSNGRFMGHVNVDDTARAAITYLNYYIHFRDKNVLEYARKALTFTMKMQDPKGLFYLYLVDETKTDLGAGDWFGRAIHALGLGYMVFKDVDAVFARRLEEAILKSKQHFPYISSTWTISHIIMGLTYYYNASHADWAKEAIELLSGKLLSKQANIENVVKEYPPWGFYSESLTYAPGLPIQALALAGRILNKTEYVNSARKATEKLFVHLAISHQFTYSDKTWFSWRCIPGTYPCPPIIPATIVKAFALSARSISDEEISKVHHIMAGLAASWFLGNNPAGVQMYNPNTGMVYDGILGEGRVNTNSGCEATEVPLDALIYVVSNEDSSRYLWARSISHSTPLMLEAENLQGVYRIARGDAFKGKYIVLNKGNFIKLGKIDLKGSDKFRILLLSRKSDCTLEVYLSGKLLKRIRLESSSWSFLSIGEFGKPGEYLLKVVEGELQVDMVVVEPFIEYRVYQISQNEYLLLGLKLFNTSGLLKFKIGNVNVTIKVDENLNVVSASSNKGAVHIDGKSGDELKDLSLGGLHVVKTGDVKVNLILFPLGSGGGGENVEKPSEVNWVGILTVAILIISATFILILKWLGRRKHGDPI
ncbi:MAG: hypothetical protein DRJ47_04030 [Thermoprotei archaeon]|nr:MAG: hypothetical protein DRJ47_04030 [Thermoprotei archaeon]